MDLSLFKKMLQYTTMHRSKGHRLERFAKKLEAGNVSPNTSETEEFFVEVKQYFFNVRPIVRGQITGQDIKTYNNTRGHVRRLRNFLGWGISDGPNLPTKL